MLLKAIIFQIVLLIFTVLWIWRCKRRGALDTTFKLAAIGVLLPGLWLGGVWVYPPEYVLFAFAFLLFVLAVRHLRKPKASGRTIAAIISNLPVLLIYPLGIFLFWQGLNGRLSPEGEFVDLHAPFPPELRACVISGGTSPLLNFHNFPSDSARDQAQIYGLDIVRLNRIGFRTRFEHSAHPKPLQPERYAMFGTPVVAPCAGIVVEQENGLPDYEIGGSDKVNTGGNGVVLQCGTHHVHLHHMKKGSVLVQLGDTVEAGQALGQVGNSGNTKEPHLHLHAETIVEPGEPRTYGHPVHMRFKGRTLARGNCF